MKAVPPEFLEWLGVVPEKVVEAGGPPDSAVGDAFVVCEDKSPKGDIIIAPRPTLSSGSSFALAEVVWLLSASPIVPSGTADADLLIAISVSSKTLD